METTTATIPGYEICQINGWEDYFAEGMAAYRRDAASRYGAAPPEEVESLLWNHYEWNLARVAESERERARDLLASGYEAARADAAEAAGAASSRAAAAYAAYAELFPCYFEAGEFEQCVLSVGREFLPACARAVLDGKEATAEYWQWMNTQVLSLRGDEGEV